MRWVILLCLSAFAAGCYAPPRAAKSCAACQSKGRPASRGTTIR